MLCKLYIEYFTLYGQYSKPYFTLIIVLQTISCDGNCEDKRPCKNRLKIPCKNSPTSKWKSCEFLHKGDHKEERIFKKKEVKIKTNIEDRISANELIIKKSPISIKGIYSYYFIIVTVPVNFSSQHI